jgi:NarL family two-component system response regulator LiaR
MPDYTSEPAPKIRIVIADDHAVVREGMRALIEIVPDMELVGEAKDGVEALLKTRSTRPDVVLLDMMMPRMDGVEAIRAIKAELPNTRIIILTSFADDDKVLAAIRAGALGYLLKDSSPQNLLQAIRDVFAGKSSLHPSIALKLIQEINRPAPTAAGTDLTDREMQILKLVAQGLSNQEISHSLTISERTVGTHISNILGKLQLTNRTQAALYALRKGIANLEPDR